ncbi:MAG: arginyltransferase [Methylovulum sp.]|nr:arginyltransferase [Methylovulum sp.]
MISIPLFLTAEHPCSYLDGKLAQSAFVHPSYPLTPAVYAQLIEQGFRRSGDEIYKPRCQQCTACLPARLPVTRFRPNRRQKRCWKKNSSTQAIIKPPVFEQAHYALYLRYQATRHSGGDMAHSSPEDYISFLSSSWCDTKFVEFSIENELAGVAVIDQFDNAYSAVYTFFEPKFSSCSLGTYAVLWQIEHAKAQQRKFLYLGFWINECKKMAYKKDYQPLQILSENRWIELP